MSFERQAQCKQKFSTMDLGLRTEVSALFEEKSEKYVLEDITYGSFTANFGFRHKFCAADVVYACLSLMEQHLESNNGEDVVVVAVVTAVFIGSVVKSVFSCYNRPT